MPGVILASNPRLESIPEVIIDNNGKFKYILCKIYVNENAAEFKHVVRGMARSEFHGKNPKVGYTIV